MNATEGFPADPSCALLPSTTAARVTAQYKYRK